MRLLVIDGNSIANRAFFGIKLLTTKDGRYTNAIYGFLNILLSLLKECEPDEVAVAFDLKAPTFRHKMYDGYKATRHGMPEELAQQMPVLKELLADLGYRTVTAEGWEADDILGTLAAACAARKDDCFLATGDRDSLQLVSDTTTVLLAATVMGRSKTVTMDVDAIQEKYGIQPRQLIEVKSLMGDASDNIPGVKGIGEKTALTLVQNFGTLEGVYEHIDDKLIKPKQREHLLECREMAQLSHTLGTIRTDAPIDTAEGTYAVGEGNKAEAVRLLQELEIHSLIPRFGLDGIAPAAPEEEDGIELAEAELEALPLTPSGTYLVASRPAVMGKQGTRNVVLQPESWYAVQDCTVYPLENADLMRLLDNADVTLEVFNAAPLYAKAMAAGGWGSSIVWDGKLAAYLLDASASKYQISELTASYRAAAAFTCADYPDAGRLADLFCKMKAEITACGEDSLYNEIEFPLAQVLADMTRTGVLVDKDGIEHLLVMPVTPTEIMLGKIWSMGLVVLLAVCLSLWLVIQGALGVPIAGSIPLFLTGAALNLFATTSLGIYLATLARSMPQFGLLIVLTVMPMQMLSGGATPRESMPQLVQDLMLAAPTTHFVELGQAILFRGAGLEVVWRPFVWLTLIGTVLFTLAWRRFRKTIGQMA